MAITDDSNQYRKMLRIDDATKGLKVMLVGGSGSGTVTSVTAGTGLTATTNPIVGSGTISLDTKLAPLDTLGTAGQSVRVNAGATALEYYTPSSTGITIGTTNITSGTNTRILYDNSGVVGEYTLTGSGTVVAMATSPTFQTSINGAYLTASQILITDGSKNIVSAPVATYPSLTELSYVKGVTSAIQTQINAKGAGTVTAIGVTTANGVSGSSSGGATPALTISLGAITPSSVQVSGLTASQLLATDASKNLVSLDTATYPSLTELSYVKGVTSAIQTQINAKGAGTVTAVSVATANGVSGSSSGGATPALTITLGAITPSTVNGVTLSGTGTLATGSYTLTVANTASISGTNTGDNATNSTYTTLATTIATANTWSAAQTFTKVIQTVTAMGAQALDGTLGNIFTRTLGASETFTQSGFSVGQCFIVKVKQGSGTSYTVTWFATVTWITSGGTAPVQTTTTNGYTTYGFVCTGSNTFDGYLVGTQ